MSVFGNYASSEVIDAAEKFISKMDEHDLASAIEQSERTMSAVGRAQLVEAVFDAFRARGESSEDAAEGAGTAVDAISRGEHEAVRKLLAYARANPGLLKEAAIGMVERDPQIVAAFPAPVTQGILERLIAK